ncbi:MAG TPA: pilus assembly protein PilP [Polyangiaceae bacterium]
MANRPLVACALLGALVAATGCDDKVTMDTGGSRSASSSEAPAASGSAKPVASAPPPRRDFAEADFTETERSRDPFRSYLHRFAEEAKSRVVSQRQVLLAEFNVDELKLVGIVTRIVPARAMLVDPTGKGHVVHRGDFVGRADVVQLAGQTGVTYQLNWRLDRIRDGDVVLVREDPNNPDVPAATKVISLRPEGIDGTPTVTGS